MAKTVSLINMKGGVGKSTLAVNLAWYMSGIQGMDNNVLVVDLDPQFNASQYLLGTSRYKREVVEAERATVWTVFEQQTRTPTARIPKPLDPDSAILTVKMWRENRLDLLPSQLELAWALKQSAPQKESLLAKFLSKVADRYHLIIIDCAPTESLLTTAAYLTSDYILVPVKPEYLSTIGLPLLAQSLDEFKMSNSDHNIEMAGVVFNHTTNYEPEERISKKEAKRTATEYKWYVFENEVTYSRSYPKGAREGEPLFNTSYARTTRRRQFEQVAEEFRLRIGL
ncbi:MAG: ParA family protein [Myxococcales bacterium]|nr:MAG: ParA family protein [Myxococcales bacterium]